MTTGKFKKIKVIIFDQDGTFYPQNSIFYKTLSAKTKLWVQDNLSIPNNKINFFYKNLEKKYPNPLLGFNSIGLTVDKYHKEVFTKVKLDEIDKDDELINLFEKISKIRKFVVTFSSIDYSNKIQKKLGIKKYIEKTYTFTDNSPTLNKIYFYKKIEQETGVKPQNIMIIGDNFKNDLESATKKDYLTIMIDCANKKRQKRKFFDTFKNIYQPLKKLCN